MRRFHIYLAFWMFLIFAIPLWAQSDCTFLFLTIETDPVALGMGNSNVAGEGSLFSAYMNPAHLNDITRGGFAYNTRSFYKNDILTKNHNYTLYSGAFRVSSKHIFRIFFQKLQYSFVGENFNYYQQAIGIGYAYRISRNASLGLSVKQLKNNDEFVDAGGVTSWAVDVGYKIRNLFPHWTSTQSFISPLNFPWLSPYRPKAGLSFGVAVLNMGLHVTYLDEGQSDPLPQTLRMGVTYYPLSSSTLEWKWSFDFEKLLVNREKPEADPFYKAWFTAWKKQPFRMNAWYHFGTEVTFYSSFSARMGFRYAPGEWVDDIKMLWTFGFGVRLKYLSVQFGKWLYGDKNYPYYQDASLLGIYIGL